MFRDDVANDKLADTACGQSTATSGVGLKTGRASPLCEIGCTLDPRAMGGGIQLLLRARAC